MNLMERFISTIKDHDLVECGNKILIGISGGPDSVCLLNLFSAISNSYSLILGAAYVNYHLRQSESDNEEKWIEKLCNNINIPLYKKDCPITSKKNLQESARKVRFQYFKEIIIKHNFDKLSLGHHLDDQLETFFMRLMRGSSLAGLSSMGYSSNYPINIIRPLLDVPKSYIIGYLNDNKISYLVDSSNLKTDYLRNRVRLMVYPSIGLVFPDYRARLSKIISNIQRDNQFINSIVDKEINRTLVYSSDKEKRIDISKFNNLDSSVKKRIIITIARQIGKHYNYFSSKNLDKLVTQIQKHNGIGSNLVFHKKDIEIYIEYSHLTIYLINSLGGGILKNLKINTAIELKNPLGVLLEVSEFSAFDYPKLSCNYKEHRLSIFVDKGRLNNNLSIRSVLCGDRVYLNQKTGLKKVKEILINSKIPRNKRKEVLVLCDGIVPFGLLSLSPFRLSLLCEDYYVSIKTNIVIRLDFKKL